MFEKIDKKIKPEEAKEADSVRTTAALGSLLKLTAVREKPADPAKQAEFENRMENLRDKGKRRGRRFSVVGIASSVAIAAAAIFIGYYISTQVKDLAHEMDGLPAVRAGATLDPDNICADDDCCLSSLKRIKRGNWARPDGQGACPPGLETKTLDCPGSLSWCEPSAPVADDGPQAGYLWHEAAALGVRFMYPEGWRVLEQEDSLTVTNNEASGVIIQLAAAAGTPAGFELSTTTYLSAGGLSVRQDHYLGSQDYNRESRYLLYSWPEESFRVSVDFEETGSGTARLAAEALVLSLSFLAPAASTTPATATTVPAVAAPAAPEDPDPDRDGLLAADEARYGTDPANPDSDGDGYTDGDEVGSGYDPAGPGKLP